MSTGPSPLPLWAIVIHTSFHRSLMAKYEGLALQIYLRPTGMLKAIWNF
jgi:hypothetical protein